MMLFIIYLEVSSDWKKFIFRCMMNILLVAHFSWHLIFLLFENCWWVAWSVSKSCGRGFENMHYCFVPCSESANGQSKFVAEKLKLLSVQVTLIPWSRHSPPWDVNTHSPTRENLCLYEGRKFISMLTRTRHWSLHVQSFKGQWLLHVLPALTFNTSAFWPQSGFVCFVWFSEWIVISPSRNWVFKY
jgi:hypothetical protein